MKIEKLLIYGFGQHENVTIDLGQGMNVFYGLNEAGKTTIQQFILHILFGFPQRNSAMLRYEPKSGGKYGGQIVLNDEIYGRCTVERIRGKSSGDVTVYFENGEKGEEEVLRLLLRQYDRTSFESIFSFSLLQLQGFEKMDEEELSRTLLASGTTGVDSLLRVEKQMEKEMSDLFKKSGRNPAMNVKMKELRELELELKEEQKKVDEYGPLIERVKVIDEQLHIFHEQEQMHRNELQQLSLLRQYVPVYQKEIELAKRVEQIETRSFPTDGIRRFESLIGQLTEAKITTRRIEDELVDLNARLPKSNYKKRLIAIDLLLAKESEWHGWNSQISLLKDEIQRLTGAKNRLFDRLGIRGKQEEIILEADVSIQKEADMHALIDEIDTVNKQSGMKESQISIIKKELSAAKIKLENLEGPTIEKIESAREWPTIRQQVAEAKAYLLFGKSEKQEKSKILSGVIFSVALLLIGFGLIQQQWFVMILGIIVGGVGAFLFVGRKSEQDVEFEKMEQFVSKYDGQEGEMEQLLTRLNTYQFDKKQLEETIEICQLNYEACEQELVHLFARSSKARASFKVFIQQYGFDHLPSPSIVPELFHMIRKLQEIERDKVEVEKQKKITERNIAQREAEVTDIMEEVIPSEVIYELLREKYMRLNEEAELKKMIEVQISQLKPQLQENALLIEALKNQLHVLKGEVSAETDEDFYKAYDNYQEMIRLQEQLTDIGSQLAMSGINHLLENKLDEELVREIMTIEAKLTAIHEQSTGLMNEKARLVNQTDRLLIDGIYGEKQQIFEMKKAELAMLAKKWAVRKAVAEAIHRTMFELKEEKLPNVLRSAGRMFGQLTGGAYEALRVTDEGYFVAEAANGMHYPIVELSQATKEQAYISLRLALASSILDVAPFPIMMDDPFVHFDEKRLSSMIKLLHASNNHQFLYFTCHKEMKDKWDGATVINVSALGSDEKEFYQ